LTWQLIQSLNESTPPFNWIRPDAEKEVKVSERVAPKDTEKCRETIFRVSPSQPSETPPFYWIRPKDTEKCRETIFRVSPSQPSEDWPEEVVLRESAA